MKTISTRFIICLLLFGISLNLKAQNNPAPEYLLTQSFPDSVANLNLLNLKGNAITFQEILKKHEGKKIVIDFWASWCKDCVVGLPKLKNLQRKTKELPVDYVFLSVDKDNSKWRNAIDRFKINGEHYRIATGWESTLANYIELDWIPRYIVINENGKILMPKAIHADDKNILKIVLD